MNAIPPLQRADFDELLAEHQRLIHLSNELEYQVYRLGNDATPEHVTDCQQAASTLIGQLRNTLFRHDQQVLPILESLISPGAPGLPC